MKKQLLTLFALGMLNTSMHAQWVSQAAGFSAVSRGISNISIPNANVAWASSYDGSGAGAAVQDFTRTLNGGTTWTPGTVSAAAGMDACDLFALNKDTAWFAFASFSAGGGAIFKTTNGGASWTQQTSSEFAAPNGFPDYVRFWDANNGLAVGDPNGGYFEIYTTSNGGTSWSRVPSGNIPAPATNEFIRFGNASAVVGNTIWCVVAGGTTARILKSTDRGMNWTVSNTGLSVVRKVTFKDANNGIILSNTGALQRTTDGGTTWTNVTTTGPVFGTSINYVPGTANALVSTSYFTGGASTGPGSSYSLDGGTTWVQVDTMVQHGHNEFFSPTVGYSGGYNTSATAGGIFKWNSSVLISVHELESLFDSFVYPNPSNGVFFVGVKTVPSDRITIRVFDLVGKMIYSSEERSNTTDYRKGVNLAGAQKGIYFVQISNGDNTHTDKVIIQ